MLSKFLWASCLLVISMASNAGIISYNGYERGSSSNIVRGGGLEWLKWDVTNGMSINSALSKYESNGWKLATNENIASLFNAFQFGVDFKSSVETYTQSSKSFYPTDSELQPYLAFMRLFGFTRTSRCFVNDPNPTTCHEPGGIFNASLAIFGSDANNNSYYQHVEVVRVNDAYLNIAYADLNGDFHGINRAVISNLSLGVALVRKQSDATNSVSLPPSLSILALGLLALYVRRQFLRC